jgi:hypothetical protein
MIGIEKLFPSEAKKLAGHTEKAKKAEAKKNWRHATHHYSCAANIAASRGKPSFPREMYDDLMTQMFRCNRELALTGSKPARKLYVAWLFRTFHKS